MSPCDMATFDPTPAAKNPHFGKAVDGVHRRLSRQSAGNAYGQAERGSRKI